MIGVLAIVTSAAIRGLVDFNSAMAKLKAIGFHLSNELIKQARLKVTADNSGD